MKKNDINIFIEEMEAIGDEWTPEQVEDVYGDYSLDEALADRKASVGTFFDIIGKVLNRDYRIVEKVTVTSKVYEAS